MDYGLWTKKINLFTLLNPTWLFAIAALSIPVVIHLWNIRPGKTLKVGSIALVEASSRKSSRSFNFLEILLLILRCLFLLLLAVLLSQPYWSQVIKPAKKQGWVLIPKQHVHQVYQQYKLQVDSLTKAGYELHYFNTGFAAIDTLKFKTMADSGKAPVANWVLLKRLNEQLPANLPIYLFTTNTLNSTAGNKPQLALNLHIKTFTPTDSVSKFIQHAALVSTGDAIKITEGNSKASGTVFTSSIVQATERSNSPYQINISNGQPSVSFKGDTSGKPVVVDTATLRIAIYSKNATDANYLSAAITSVKQFTARKIQITRFTDASLVSANQSWIFWLSDQAVPSVLATKTTNLFTYEPGKAQAIHSTINISGESNIALSKHIAAANSSNQILWQDGFGAPVLSVANNGKTNSYHFYTHFDPAWNDLVWSDGFARIMLNLLIDTHPAIAAENDKRVMDEQQLLPNTIADKSTITQNTTINTIDLSKAFWIALFLLLVAERWLAHRTNTETNG